jgi:hypothetical protein
MTPAVITASETVPQARPGAIVVICSCSQTTPQVMDGSDRPP